ncbi:MAG: hypothetical protein RLZZ505_263 [Verrucomicrobiota bacterium]|jgi:hypothetical protein
MKYLLLLTLVLPLRAGEINTLSPEEKAAGWQLLFNGKDLGNFRRFQSKANPGPGWKIEHGILKKIEKIPGGNIVTKEKYGDFILSWEWNISPKGNNGIKYLVVEDRADIAGPEYQMLDDSGHPDGKIGAQRQTASLYDILPPAQDKLLKPVGTWNHSKIVVKGTSVEHWLNGTQVLAYQLESEELKAAIARSKFKNAKGFEKKVNGHIMLTDHVDGCSFRNIKILPSED